MIDFPANRLESAACARALIAAGAEVDARRDDENGTALAGAICASDIDVVEVLVEAGADIQAACGWRDGTVIDVVDERCEGLHNDDVARRLQAVFTKASGRQVPKRPAIGQPVPLLFVSDFDAGLNYYTEKVGFRLVWSYDENPDCPYGSIVRGGTDFHLTVCACDDKAHIGKLDARIETREIDDLFAELQAAGVIINSEPVDQPWGLREFEMSDPDGNKLTFFQH